MNQPAAENRHQLIDRGYRTASFAVFGVLGVLVLMTFADYGYSFDEVCCQRAYGQAVIAFLRSFGDILPDTGVPNMELYGGLFDGVVEMVASWFPGRGFDVRRLLTAGVGMFAMVGTWKLGRALGGEPTAFWSLLLLAITPMFYGHMFMNPKDIPFAAGAVWSVYYTICIVRALPSAPLALLVKLGLALGLATGTRIGGLIVIAYFGLAVLSYLALALLRERKPLPGIAVLAKAALVPLLVCSIVTVLFWPAMMVDPIDTLTRAIAATKNFPYTNAVLFGGDYVPAQELPRSYIPVYFFLTLPELFLLGLPLAAVWLMKALGEDLAGVGSATLVAWGLVLFACLFPPLYAMATGATAYDAVRHFLFIVPPLAVIAGAGFAKSLGALAANRHRLTLLVLVVLVVFLARHIVLMSALHPYQYAYFNRLAGGMPAAGERFETDYWMTSYKEAAGLMLEYLQKYCLERKLDCGQTEVRVAVAMLPQGVIPFVPANVRVGDLGYVEQPHFYIASTRWNLDHKQEGMRQIAEVKRQGMTFAVVKTSLPP